MSFVTVDLELIIISRVMANWIELKRDTYDYHSFQYNVKREVKKHEKLLDINIHSADLTDISKIVFIYDDDIFERSDHCIS